MKNIWTTEKYLLPAQPVGHGVRAEQAATEQLTGRDVRLLVVGGQQRGDDGSLTFRVLVQETAKVNRVNDIIQHLNFSVAIADFIT